MVGWQWYLRNLGWARSMTISYVILVNICDYMCYILTMRGVTVPADLNQSQSRLLSPRTVVTQLLQSEVNSAQVYFFYLGHSCIESRSFRYPWIRQLTSRVETSQARTEALLRFWCENKSEEPRSCPSKFRLLRTSAMYMPPTIQRHGSRILNKNNEMSSAA